MAKKIKKRGRSFVKEKAVVTDSSPKSFIETVRMISLINMKIAPHNVFSLVIQHGFWTHNFKCTPTAMMKFCNFLKSKQGSEILANFQKKAELSTKDCSFDKAHMLSRQLMEFADARKRRTAEIEADIAEHHCQIVLLEKKLEKEIVEVERCYLPASRYVPLDEQELLKTCYNMYVDELLHEETLRELDQELIEFVKSEYEEEVRLSHMSDFMADEKWTCMLKVWTDEKNETDGVLP